jgi:hypothetical protein
MKICTSRPLPWYRPVVVSQALDWLAALDDLLTQRVRSCLICGRPVQDVALLGIWDLSRQRNVAYSMHHGCWQEGRATPAVRAVLAARYGDEVAEGIA